MEADHQAGAAAAPQQPATQHGAPGGLGDPQDDAAMQALAGGGQPGGGGGDGALVGVKRQAPGDPDGDADEEPKAKRLKEEGEEDASGTPTAAVAHAAAATSAGGQALPPPLPLDPAAAAALGLTPDQQAHMAAMQQQLMQFPLAFSPEALAAAAAAGPDGHPLLAAQALLGGGGGGGEGMAQLAIDPTSITVPIYAPDGSLLSQEQIIALFGSASMPLLVPLAGQGMQLAGQAGLAQGLPPGGLAGGVDGGYRNWWEDQEEQDLVQLVEDPSFRLEKLGSEALEWASIAGYFGQHRTVNAVRKKYWQLTKRADSDSDGMELTAVDPTKRPRADRRLWSDAETEQLIRLATDPLYRVEVLRVDPATPEQEWWEAIAMQFGVGVQTAKRKYRLSMEAMQAGTLVPGAEKGKRQHHRKKTPYRWMIVTALGELPNFQGTAPDIFDRIDANPDFTPDLDHRIMPGTKHVPRWKIQIRKVLSADKIFQHTGLKQKHETVWRLDQHELHQAQASSRSAGRNTAAAIAAEAACAKLPQFDPNAPALPAADAAMAAAAAAAAASAGGQLLSGRDMGAGAGGLPAGSHAMELGPQHAEQLAFLQQQQMEAVQQQIAAVIAAAPLVMLPDQLQQGDELHLAGGGAHPLALQATHGEQAGNAAAAAAAAMGELAGHSVAHAAAGFLQQQQQHAEQQEQQQQQQQQQHEQQQQQQVQDASGETHLPHFNEHMAQLASMGHLAHLPQLNPATIAAAFAAAAGVAFEPSDHGAAAAMAAADMAGHPPGGDGAAMAGMHAGSAAAVAQFTLPMVAPHAAEGQVPAPLGEEGHHDRRL